MHAENGAIIHLFFCHCMALSGFNLFNNGKINKLVNVFNEEELEAK